VLTIAGQRLSCARLHSVVTLSMWSCQLSSGQELPQRFGHLAGTDHMQHAAGADPADMRQPPARALESRSLERLGVVALELGRYPPDLFLRRWLLDRGGAMAMS
jgi:hypothetical protein